MDSKQGLARSTYEEFDTTNSSDFSLKTFSGTVRGAIHWLRGGKCYLFATVSIAGGRKSYLATRGGWPAGSG